MSSSKLYVGGLPYATNERELEDLFAEYGDIESVRIITDRMTGRSRGFGFVEFGASEDAEAAIEALNGKDFQGRTLIVNVAKPRSDSGGGGGGRPQRNRW